MVDSGKIIRTSEVSWPLGFNAGVHRELTARENARFVARIYGKNESEVTDFAFEFSELGEYFDMPMRTYSSGMRARLVFGLSMAIDFDVYLIDELTAVGDKPFQEKCRKAFRNKREKSSVIIVSHQMNTVKQYADTFAVLINGQLELFHSFQKAKQAYQQLLR
jgi:capsular polysaccharide transport system ATP-binding protein